MKRTRRFRAGRALLYAGFTAFGFCVSCIDSAPLLGCIGTLVGLGMMLAAQVVGGGR